MMTRLSTVAMTIAAALGIAVHAPASPFRKALVYCPLSIDAAGCNIIVAALSAPDGPFPDGVDRAYDGTGGTIDLVTADLSGYSALIVPSLADNGPTRPYDLLRDSLVARRLAQSVGRVAVWSGTPDQGSANRAEKDALLRNLAAWASVRDSSVRDSSVTRMGVVVLQDHSGDVTRRYGWLDGLARLRVGADTTAQAYARVEALDAVATQILGGIDAPLAYGNMASFGLRQLGGGSADATGVATAAEAGTSAIVRGGRSPVVSMSVAAAVASGPGPTVLITAIGQPMPTLIVNPAAGVYGGTVTLRATLMNGPLPLAGKSVAFKLNGAGLGSAVTNASGVAVIANAPLGAINAGSYPSGIGASFAGDASTAGVTARPAALTVAPRGTTLTVASASGSFGGRTTLTATLMDAAGLPLNGAAIAFTLAGHAFITPAVTNTSGVATWLDVSLAGIDAGEYASGVSASFAPQANYNGSNGSAVLTVAKVTPDLVLAVDPASVSVGGTVSLQASLAVGGTPLGGKTVVFTIAGESVGAAQTASAGAAGVATVSVDLKAHPALGASATPYAVTASFDGAADPNFGGASDARTLTVTKLTQSIIFAAIADRTYGDAAFALSATATSGLPVNFTASGNCSVAEAAGSWMVSPATAGRCTITASQPGDGSYAAAPDVSQSFSIGQAAQTIAFASIGDRINGAAPFAVHPTASSGLPISSLTIAGDCAISGSTVSTNLLPSGGTGSCTVTATQGGTENYLPAPPVSRPFAILRNAPPVVGAITASSTAPIALGTSITISSLFTDVDVPESAPYRVSIDWGDGTAPTTSTQSAPGAIGGSHTYAGAGVWTVTVRASDKIPGNTGMNTYLYVVVYDNTGGFVTGGGWIMAPAGSFPASPSLAGKSTFGFNAKYKKGAAVPDGNTEFQFHPGGLNFKATSYDWLVVNGAKLQYMGSGTVNGAGDYAFLFTAIDGGIDGTKVDRARLKVWEKATGRIIFDSELGVGDAVDPTTVSQGGNITIHK